MLPSETVSNIFHPSLLYAIEPLVGMFRLQAAKTFDVRPQLDILEVSYIQSFGKLILTGVPAHLYSRKRLPGGNEPCQPFHFHRFGIPSHETDASCRTSILLEKCGKALFRQQVAHILHQIGTMATFATIWTIGYIDGKRHLVRYLLKYDVIISIPEHSIFVRPPSAVAERSC